jgi:7-cyano-7-deazaguanine reductase
MSKTDISGLTQLGRRSDIAATPDDAKLESVPNPAIGAVYAVRFTAPEFTCLCPLTGQPDFAHIVIDYVPGPRLVESKSLKLFLTSFRNHGDFHEATTLRIAKAVIDAAEPQWLRIGAYWYPRGGIPIDVFFEHGTRPEGLWVPEQGVPNYRGRG